MNESEFNIIRKSLFSRTEVRKITQISKATLPHSLSCFKAVTGLPGYKRPQKVYVPPLLLEPKQAIAGANYCECIK